MTLAQLFNQNSYIVAAIFLLTMVLFIFWRVRQNTIKLAIIIATALILVAFNFLLRVGTSEIESTTQFDEILAAHEPVVLEIYSNY